MFKLLVVCGAIGGLVAIAAARAFSPSARVDPESVTKAGGRWFRTSRDERVVEWFEYGAKATEARSTVLALHGAMTTGQMWAAHDAWAREHGVRIVAPSLPGWGWSESAPNSSPLQWASTDAAELFQQAGLEGRVHLLGASLGSIYAAELVAASSTVAQSIGNVMLYVAIAPASDSFDPLSGSDLNVFAKLHHFPTFARLLDKYLLIPLLVRAAGGDVARSLNLWEGLWRCTDDIRGPRSPFVPDLCAHRRVFVVSGLSDTAAPPANQHKLIELIPGSELIQFDGEHDAAVKNATLLQQHLALLIESRH